MLEQMRTQMTERLENGTCTFGQGCGAGAQAQPSRSGGRLMRGPQWRAS